MQILIVDNPVVAGPGIEVALYRQRIQAIAGQWIEVETEHLFEDQYNVKDLRVHQKHVKTILADARIGRMKCRNCGTTQILSNQCVKGCHHKWLHPFSQNKDFKTFVYAYDQRLFWRDKFGWIKDIKKASRLRLKQVLLLTPPTMCNAVVPLKGFSYDH